MASVKKVDGKYVVVGRVNPAKRARVDGKSLKQRLKELQEEQYRTIREMETRDPSMARSARKLLGAVAS